MELQQLVLIIKRGWWVIVAVTLLGAGIALVVTLVAQPTYEAVATFVTNPGFAASTVDELVYSLDTLSSRTTLVSTYCEVLQSGAIVTDAAARLGVPMSVITEERANSRPQYEVSCVVLPDSSVLQLSVKGPSPQLTADLANTIGAAGLDYVQSLQEVYNLRVLDAAATPDSPIAPVMPVNLGLGATIGLIMGLVVTYIQQTFIQQRQAALSPAPGSSAL